MPLQRVYHLLLLQPDVCGHVNGGPTSLDDEGLLTLVNETELILQFVQAGNLRSKKVRVIRTDLRPQIVLKNPPRSLRKSTLPKEVTLKVVVTDKKGDPMPDATVDFTLGAAGYPGDTGSKTTDSDGRASWTTEVPWSDSLRDTIPVTVTATPPSGDSAKESLDITLK